MHARNVMIFRKVMHVNKIIAPENLTLVEESPYNKILRSCHVVCMASIFN